MLECCIVLLELHFSSLLLLWVGISLPSLPPCTNKFISIQQVSCYQEQDFNSWSTRTWAFQEGHQKLLPFGVSVRRRPQITRRDSHCQSFSTAEVPKLGPAPQEFLPLLKTRLEELRIILSKKCLSILPSAPGFGRMIFVP